MSEQKSPRSLKPLFITTGVLASAVIVTSYVLFSPSHDVSETAINSAALSNSAISASEIGQQIPELAPELLNGVNKEQLLALLPKASPDDNIPVQDRQAISLWQKADQDNVTTDPDQLRVEHVVADPTALTQLEVGRKVDFVIPHTDEAVSGEITAQQSANNGVKVYDIKLNNNNPLTGAQIVRGKQSTDVAVITEQGNYTVSINNKTGAGTVIDDRDLNIYRTESDVVLVPTQAPPKPKLEPTS